MKNLKSIIVILAGAALVFSLALGGCAKPAPPPAPAPAPSPAPAPTPAPAPAPKPAPAPAPKPAPPTEPTPKYGGTLRVLYGSIRPIIGWPPDLKGSVMAVVQGTLETLLRGDPQGDVYPWLAESYKVADDMQSITFTLRKGVKFHDGSDLNAEVVKWNLENYMTSARSDPNWASVDIIDDYTVRVNFTEWKSTLPMSFAEGINTAFLISKAAFDKNGIDWVKKNPVGTGPFKFVSFTPDVVYKTVRNPDYWVKGKPYLDGLEYIFVADPQTAKMLMEAGEADMVSPMMGKLTADYAAMGLKVKAAAESTWVIVPNTADADSPWANKKVREAVAYAIDRETIAKSMGFGYWQAPYQIPPRSSLAYDPNFTLGRKYDPEKARQLLAEAGYADGLKTKIILFPFVDKRVALVMQSQLAEVGIQIDFEYTTFSKWVPYMFPGSWPTNAALFTPIPRFDARFVGGTQFIMNMLGKSWLRTPELLAANKAILTAPAPDVKLVRAFTDIITKDALLIPAHEGGLGRAEQSYVVAGYNKRGFLMFWDAEDAWLNK